MKKIPKFKNVDEEIEFWLTHGSADYIDWSKSKRTTFPNLKPSSKVVSMRLPETLLNDIKFLAHKRGVSYQSLMRTFLYEKAREELKKIDLFFSLEE